MNKTIRLFSKTQANVEVIFRDINADIMGKLHSGTLDWVEKMIEIANPRAASAFVSLKA